MIHLHNDCILVRLDPIPEKVGSIVVPDSSQAATNIRTGTVLRTGPGRWSKNGKKRIPVAVSTGDKVAFFRANLEHLQGKQITQLLQEIDKHVGLIREDDVLYILESQ